MTAYFRYGRRVVTTVVDHLQYFRALARGTGYIFLFTFVALKTNLYRFDVFCKVEGGTAVRVE